MANIFSLLAVEFIPGVCITMDATIEQVIPVYFKGEGYKLKTCKGSIYYFDTTTMVHTTT